MTTTDLHDPVHAPAPGPAVAPTPEALAVRGGSYVERLTQLAHDRPDEPALGELHALRELRRQLTWSQLDRRCRAVAARLQSLGAQGERALIACDNDPDYLIAFLGCAYAGVIAVPLYAPTQRNHLERYATIAADCSARFILSTDAVVARNTRLGMARQDFPDLQWLLVDQVPDREAAAWQAHWPHTDSLCYLQYTSGSTGTPRGVMVHHAHLMYQGAYNEAGCGLDGRDRALSWLPLYHDMGLIVGALQALYTGIPLLLTTPAAVVMHPERWLRAISDHRISFAGAPNFVYDLCVDGVDPQALAGVDLSCWDVAFNAAEPIRAATVERFTRHLAPLGLPATAMCPAYGLAEATLAVSIKKRGTPAEVRPMCAQALKANRLQPVGDAAPAPAAGLDQQAGVSAGVEAAAQATTGPAPLPLVGSGRVLLQTAVRIVDPETGRALPQGHVGEIWVGGTGPAAGYWGRPQDTLESFGARLAGEDGPFMRTGDLGAFDEHGELYVTGRLKDVIIVAGKNHYPQDIEQTVELCDPALRVHAVAAVPLEQGQRETLLVMAEVHRREVAGFDAAAVAAVIRRRVAQRHELDLAEVVFLQRGQLPMTTSGKIRRRAARERLLAGELQVLARASF